MIHFEQLCFRFLLFLSDLVVRDFLVSYKIANNFPLDLYFLNDPSPTMKSLQNSLKSLAKSIGEFQWENNDLYQLNTDPLYIPYKLRDTLEKNILKCQHLIILVWLLTLQQLATGKKWKNAMKKRTNNLFIYSQWNTKSDDRLSVWFRNLYG